MRCVDVIDNEILAIHLQNARYTDNFIEISLQLRNRNKQLFQETIIYELFQIDKPRTHHSLEGCPEPAPPPHTHTPNILDRPIYAGMIQ